jgi:beta-glucosidase
MSTLNNRVRAVLKLIDLASKSGIPKNATERRLDRSEDRQLLRQVASESIVLLMNDDQILPFGELQSLVRMRRLLHIVVEAASRSNPYYTVTPFEGVETQAVAGVDFAQGVYGHQSLPLLGRILCTVDGKAGFTMKVYNEPAELPPTATD